MTKLKTIDNFTELLKKFDAIGFETYEDKKFSRGSWELHYRVEMSEIFGLQLVFVLRYQKHTITSWGCIDHDNTLAIRWIAKTKSEIREWDDKLSVNASNLGKEIFNEL